LKSWPAIVPPRPVLKDMAAFRRVSLNERA
jgi:hypothetical protein